MRHYFRNIFASKLSSESTLDYMPNIAWLIRAKIIAKHKAYEKLQNQLFLMR